jgi:hypothetical protein
MLIDHSAVLLRRIEAAVQQATEESADDLVEKMRARLREPKSGRPYGAAGTHVASAPGEPPATDTGNLERSTQSRPIPGGAEVFVSEAASYAALYLEEGSPSGRIAPRPWFWPTAEQHRDDYERALARALREALR